MEQKAKNPSHDNWYNPNDKRFKWTPDRLKAVAESLNAWVDKCIKEKKHFLLGDWCFETGFLPSYFGRLRERSIELDEAYLRAKSWQAHNIAKGALFNKLNGRFASLWLANHHKEEGWTIFNNQVEKNESLPAQIEELNQNMKKAYELIDKKV